MTRLIHSTRIANALAVPHEDVLDNIPFLDDYYTYRPVELLPYTSESEDEDEESLFGLSESDALLLTLNMLTGCIPYDDETILDLESTIKLDPANREIYEELLYSNNEQ